MGSLMDAVQPMKDHEYFVPKIDTDESIINEFYVALNSVNKEVDIPVYIQNRIYRLLDLCVTGKDQRAIQIILNDVFLSNLYSLVSDSKIDFSKDEYRYKFNRICYDYFRLRDHNIFIQNKMLDIVFVINNKIAQTLMGFNLTKEQASILVAARYSTATNIRINFKRITRTIQNMSSKIMTEQNIVNIYGKTCTEPVSELFISIMLDSYSDFYTEDEEYVYSTVNLAILDIIESLSMEHIYNVLTAYMRAQSCSDKTPRFQLRAVNIGDYPRINNVIDRMEAEGIYVY